MKSSAKHLFGRAYRVTVFGAGLGSLYLGTNAVLGRHRMLSESSETDNPPKNFPIHLQHMSTGELLKGAFIYEVCSQRWLINTCIHAMHLCDKLHLPLLYTTVCRHSFFQHFCGGETMEAVAKRIVELNQNRVLACLNYAREVNLPKDLDEDTTSLNSLSPNKLPEPVKQPSNEEQMQLTRIAEDALLQNKRTIMLASKHPGSLYAGKFTPFINPLVLQRYGSLLNHVSADSAPSFIAHLKHPELTDYERSELCRFWNYAEQLCTLACENEVKVFVDAEQSNFEGCIHALTLDLMRLHNRKRAIVHDTFQMYLKKSPEFLQSAVQLAIKEKWCFGVKLVRGAYLESEPRHLIWDTKAETDKAYDNAVNFVFEEAAKHARGATFKNENQLTNDDGKWGLMIATHNKTSVYDTINKISLRANDLNRVTIYLAQLLGMADDITYAIAHQDSPHFYVVKYVCWGKLAEALPYLVRRAEENSSSLNRAVEERFYYRAELSRRLKSVFKS
ncbi:proline dehydrogenase [Schizosaccharomyces japonicus yFS275]|uniref:Proline dehydrogenase n=1 Tax=Schizosaccharomyces japonicus (strain yFS275 / FY16936) TaxID=402676 RepID=B6JZ77_SCHJY|nr:proline dehydrogenase [Schizosaccharomyces japonicus yFS275]EEB06845.1 proline dehydrogenase [Schizosaccharomyces japonicus yFS275]